MCYLSYFYAYVICSNEFELDTGNLLEATNQLQHFNGVLKGLTHMSGFYAVEAKIMTSTTFFSELKAT